MSSVAADGKDKRGLKLETSSRFTDMPAKITKTVVWVIALYLKLFDIFFITVKEKALSNDFST